MWSSSRDSSPYNEPALPSLHSCESIDTPSSAPISPPYSISEFKLSSQKPRLYDEPAMPLVLEDFDNWVNGWDDYPDNTIFPLVEPLSPMFKLDLLPPAIDAVELSVGTSIPPRSSIDPATVFNGLDNSSVSSENPVTEEHLFNSPSASPKITNEALRHSLYSPPLYWERPQFSPNSYNTPMSPISPTSSIEDLCTTAMPAQQSPVCLMSSPAPVPQTSHNSRKRKPPPSPDSDSPTPRRRKGSVPKKTAHNMIEKRYRTNLNVRIGALRDRIPSLRGTAKDNSSGEELLENSQVPPQRFSKATVLSKAIEYITHLERCAKDATKENRALQARVDAFEMLVAAQCGPKSSKRNAPTCHGAS